MNAGELVPWVSLAVTVGGLGVAYGRAQAEARAIRRELDELRASSAAQGRRLGGLKTAVAVLARDLGKVPELAQFLDGGAVRRPTLPGLDESGEHQP